MVFSNTTTPTNTATLLRQAFGSLLSIAFPSSCPICRQELTRLNWTGACDNCWNAIEPWKGAVCSCCGLPSTSVWVREGSELSCPDCQRGEMNFDRARSFGLYRDVLRAAILTLKFQRRERWGFRLGSLLIPALDNLFAEGELGPAVVVPVPLHKGRQRERGYNQAELLAAGLLQTLAKSRGDSGLRPATGVLIKTRATKSQAGLSLAARRENVHGAFAVRRAEEIRDRVVILVDDVMTTGATLSACALVLKRAGARQVLGLTLARATPQFPDAGAHSDRVNIDESSAGRR